MKKLSFLSIILLTSTHTFSQWTDYGTNISTTDNVGIGVGATVSKLHIAVSEDSISWPVTINNTLNSEIISGYGVGVKLKHSWNHEHWKWGGIASVQEGSWANTSGLALYANETEYVRIRHNGYVGIGTSTPDSKLTVKGKIHAEEVKIDLSVPAPDYVFKKEYDLPTLEQVQQYIQEKGHLPNIPSAKMMETEGVDLGTMNMKLLEKIEELTLYTIEQQKEIKELKSIVEKMIKKR